MELNQDGYLIDISSWNEEIAINIAETNYIELTQEHWQIIYALRKFYAEFKLSPTTRVLVNYLQNEFGTNNFNNGTLNLLFNGKPAKLAAKIAGLPKPNNCI